MKFVKRVDLTCSYHTHTHTHTKLYEVIGNIDYLDVIIYNVKHIYQTNMPYTLYMYNFHFNYTSVKLQKMKIEISKRDV